MEIILQPEIVASIIGLVAVSKMWLPSKYAILVSLGLGILFVLPENKHWAETIIYGLSYGLSASGLWSGAKGVTNAVTSK